MLLFEAVTDTTQKAGTNFWMAESPLWVSLLAALIAVLSVAFTFMATRDAMILRAPDFEIVYDETQTHHSEIRFRIWNRGKVDAFNVKVEWIYDPLGLHHDKESWVAGRIRAGDYQVATLDAGSSEDVWRWLERHTDPKSESRTGKITYRSQLAWFKKATVNNVALPKPDDTYKQGFKAAREAQEELHRERAARNPAPID